MVLCRPIMAMKQNFYRRKLPDKCIDFASEAGKQLFKEALEDGYMNAYFSLGQQLRTQDEPAYCGLSSLVMVLNALAIDPGKVWKGVWRWYHEDMLECGTPLDEIKVKGVTMDQLSCIARCNHLEAKTILVNDEANIDTFRQSVKKMCGGNGVAIIASFGRRILQQTGDGHFAPLGGYHAINDMVLVLEPARFKYSPFWLPLTLLWKAMNTVDSATGKSRGYMLLQKSAYQPTLLIRLSKLFCVINPFEEMFISSLQALLEFLKQQVHESTAEVFLGIIVERLLKIATSYKGKGNPMFFKSLSKSAIEALSPEDQIAVTLLVQYIEDTELYRLLRNSVLTKTCCSDQSFCKLQKCVEDCLLKHSCFLCLPHYVTIVLYVLTAFSPNSTLGHVAGFSLSKEDFQNSYLQKISHLMINNNEAEFSLVPNSTEGKYGHDQRSQHLFLNEINQLQRQILNLLSVTNEKSCCGSSYCDSS